jgi:NAD(P)H-flavin reductase
VDVRLTVADGYRTERSYSIASPPEEQPRVTLTVERLDEGEVSPYLTEELRGGDTLELRGPIGGYFVWEAPTGGPLLLVAGGSGIVPLMAMIRHRAAAGSTEPTRLLYSSRSYADIIYHDELELLVRSGTMLEVEHTLTRAQPSGWTGYQRCIDEDMLREVTWPAEQHPLIYICGPVRSSERPPPASSPWGMTRDESRPKTSDRQEQECDPAAGSHATGRQSAGEHCHGAGGVRAGRAWCPVGPVTSNVRARSRGDSCMATLRLLGQTSTLNWAHGGCISLAAPHTRPPPGLRSRRAI